MTGRELIIYILKNHLENEVFFEDGKIPGFMTISEAATKFEVGVATIGVWLDKKLLDGFCIGKTVYIPLDAKSPMIIMQNTY